MFLLPYNNIYHQQLVYFLNCLFLYLSSKQDRSAIIMNKVEPPTKGLAIEKILTCFETRYAFSDRTSSAT